MYGLNLNKQPVINYDVDVINDKTFTFTKSDTTTDTTIKKDDVIKIRDINGNTSIDMQLVQNYNGVADNDILYFTGPVRIYDHMDVVTKSDFITTAFGTKMANYLDGSNDEFILTTFNSTGNDYQKYYDYNGNDIRFYFNHFSYGVSKKLWQNSEYYYNEVNNNSTLNPDFHIRKANDTLKFCLDNNSNRATFKVKSDSDDLVINLSGRDQFILDGYTTKITSMRSADSDGVQILGRDASSEIRRITNFVSTAESPNVYVDSDGHLMESSSSIRYKQVLPENDTLRMMVHNVRKDVIDSIRFRYYKFNNSGIFYGPIAEELFDIDPNAVYYKYYSDNELDEIDELDITLPNGRQYNYRDYKIKAGLVQGINTNYLLYSAIKKLQKQDTYLDTLYEKTEELQNTCNTLYKNQELLVSLLSKSKRMKYNKSKSNL